MGVLALIYAGLGYVAFLAAITYFMFFTADALVPKGLSDGIESAPAMAAAINAALLGSFAIQHTIMAREGFKKRWTKIVPESMERATFVWASNLLVGLICWQWRPMNGVIWDLSGTGAELPLTIVYWAGWALLVASSFMIDHFGLFGLIQVWHGFKKTERRHVDFRVPMLYAWVRHPMMTGVLIAVWAAPVMTTGRLLLAGLMSGYILVGVRFEENGLVSVFGDAYRNYQKQVPMLVPIPGKRFREEA